MARPKDGYRLADGTKVPSVTTVLGRFKESGGLVHWAWDLGMKGVDYRKARDAAADAGTIAHWMVEQHLETGHTDFDVETQYPEADEPTIDKAQIAFEAFLAWSDQTHLQIYEAECPMVSEKYKFGGTPDAILVKGKLSLGDWKTSNSIYPEYLIQLAAYKKLYEENRPVEIVGGYHLLRFDKKYGDFHAHWWAELDTAWDSFKLMLRLYENMKELKERCK